MSKGITHSCVNIWRAIARPGKWASMADVVRDWYGIYSAAEVKEHITTLTKGGFLEEGESLRDGAMFAYTPKCIQLPGETLLPVAGAIDAPEGQVAKPREIDLMGSFYRPAQTAPNRPGALDHETCQSLQMGKRRTFRSLA